MRIVVLGGYGNFGARICRALAADPGMEVIAAGRDPERGHREARFDERVGKARVDRTDPALTSALRALAPRLVIHCAGPFQGQDYRVAIAGLSAGAHYIDLADGRDFVTRFSREVGPVAEAAGLFAVSGASSVPALSSAVVDEFAGRFHVLEEIQIAIAPAQRAPRGTATLRGVFSYAGKPFQRLKDGTWQTAYGWQDLRRLRFADLGARWAAACDVPDLALFPARYPGVRTVEFRAALELGIEHLALLLAAQLRRSGLAVPLERWAGPLERVAAWLDPFGGESGGMWLRLTGSKKDGTKACVDWQLTAPGNHGPEIPCMPAILLARKLRGDEITARGAAPCMGFLTLGDFAPEFTRWGMHTRIREA